jgi:hypothetical protein
MKYSPITKSLNKNCNTRTGKKCSMVTVCGSFLLIYWKTVPRTENIIRHKIFREIKLSVELTPDKTLV